MKKRFLSILTALALCLGLLPGTALAAEAASPGGVQTVTVTDWEQFGVPGYNRSDYTLKNGDTLDLSQMSEEPAHYVFITIEEGNATSTIIGNPQHTFSNVIFNFGTNTGTNLVSTPTNILLKLQDYRTSSNLGNFDQMREDYDMVVEYSGEVCFQSGISVGPYQKCVNLTLRGKSGDKLSLGAVDMSRQGSIAGDISLTFDGGHVETTDQIFLQSATSSQLHVQNGCDLTVRTAGNNKAIYVSPSKVAGETSLVSIQGSTVDIDTNGHTGGGIVGADGIEIADSQVTVRNTSDEDISTFWGGPAIGDTGDIVIDHSTVVAETRFIPSTGVWRNKKGGPSAAIGGEYNSITIENNSNVTAIGYYGAGIGRRGASSVLESNWNTEPQSITIASSTVNAYSVYGAGIGSGWVPTSYTGTETSTTDITISGDSDVTAVSQNGAGIGAGATSEVAPMFPLEFTIITIGGWVRQGTVNGDATLSRALSVMSLGEPASAQQVDGLATDNGTLTIQADSDTPEVKAESGVKAVSLKVNAEQPMMEYTLSEDEEAREIPTPVNRTNSQSQETSSYNLRPGFRSLAFWPVASGSYTLSYGSYGSTDPDPLLDENNSYAETYTLSDPASGGGALNSFTVVRQRKLGGEVTLSANVGESTADGTVMQCTELTAVLSSLTPSGVQGGNVTYQWYKDGTAIDGKTSADYTPSEAGVYFCAVTGTGLYRGTVNSQAVTVAVTLGEVPAAPTATQENAITANSITLDVPSDGTTYQYGLVTADGIKWQSTLTFDGLARNTAYSFVQREGDSGAVSAAAVFTTRSGKPEDPIDINYEAETFSVKEAGVSLYKDDKCTTKITGSLLGAYMGGIIYAKYDDETAVNEETVAAVQIPARPEGPDLESAQATPNSITLSGVSGAVYGLFYPGNTSNIPNESITCTSDGESITFSGLNSNTQYTIKAQTPATDSAFRSENSEETVSTTTAKASIAVVPGNNDYSYDGTEKTFDFTVLPAGVDKSTFTVSYSFRYGSGPQDVQDTKTVGTYDVTVTRNEDGDYNSFSRKFVGGMTISKGTATEIATDTVALGTTGANTVQITLAENSGYGTIESYAIGTMSEADKAKLNTTPTVSDTGVLSYTLAAGATAGNFVIPVIVTTTNCVVTVNVTVTATDKSVATVTVTQDGCTYGTALPKPVISVTGDGTPLTEACLVQYTGRDGTDYSPSTNKPILGGSYTITATYDHGSYYGTGKADFVIEPQDVTLTLAADAASPVVGRGTVHFTLTGLLNGETAELKCSDPSVTAILGEENTWTVTLPGKDETYTFTAHYDGSRNYKEAQSNEVQVTNQAPVTYQVTVNGGTGSGQYEEETCVTITADSPAEGRQFSHWTVETGGVTLDNPNSAQTTFTMPAQAVTVTAHFQNASTPPSSGGTTYCTLTFETNGGSKIDDVRKPYGTMVDLGKYTSTRAGYVFTGWYSDKDLTEKIASIKLGGNKTVYAGWEKDNAGYADCPRDRTCPAARYKDVNLNEWYHDGIHYCVEHGLMSGTSADTFEPNTSTSRAMIATILWRQAGSPVVNYLMDFSDVDASAYYGEAVRWAASEDIVSGYGNGQFGPNDPITREQMAAILYNYAGSRGQGFTGAWAFPLDFPDAEQVSPWAYEALCWCTMHGVINGTNQGTLAPKGQATRAQAAVILTRFCESIE